MMTRRKLLTGFAAAATVATVAPALTKDTRGTHLIYDYPEVVQTCGFGLHPAPNVLTEAFMRDAPVPMGKTARAIIREANREANKAVATMMRGVQSG